jgi:hypothetical protein
MLSKPLFSLGAGLLACAALAQTTIGTTVEVKGLVTVSDGSTMANAVAGSPIIDGSRYITGSSGTATLRLSNDCVLKLRPNQSITIDGQKTCDELLAFLDSGRGTLAGLQASAAGAGVTVDPWVALGTIASLGLLNNKHHRGLPNPPISNQ